jgi:Kef-type K+ transport system membrane component KefB
VAESLGLALVVAGAVLVICALCAPLFARVHQPRVVAELCVGIVAGLFLSQSIDALRIPLAVPYLKSVLYWISEPALLAYMFCLGYETNLARFKDGLVKSSSIAAWSIVVPFGLTYCVLTLRLPWGIEGGSSTVGNLAICGAMAVTAFPVMSRILEELKLLGSRVGIVALSAAAMEDVFSWTLLAVLTSIVARSTALPNMWLRAALSALCVVAIVLGRSYLKRRPSRYAGGAVTIGILASSVLLALLLRIDLILLAFATGLLVPRTRWLSAAVRRVQGWAASLMPLFFLLSGINAANRGLLADLPAIGIWTALASAATGGASYAAARAGGFDKQGALMVASLMNCRGVVGLIFLSVGLRYGLITPHTYGVLLFVALITTLMSTPLIVLSVRLTGRSLTAAAEQAVSPSLAEA